MVRPAARLPLRPDAIAIAFLVFALRAPIFGVSALDPDESMYLIIGREVLNGHLPYVTTFQEKPLGAPLTVATAMAIFGPTVLAIRILGCVAITITALLLRQIVMTAGLSRLAGFLAAALYALMTTRVGGLATNTELLFAPLTTAAAWIAVRDHDTADAGQRRRAILLFGLFIGLGVWFKYIAALPGMVMFILLAGSWWLRGRIRLGELIFLGALCTAMVILPTALSATFYFWQGHWEEFWYCNFGFMRNYLAVGELPRPRGIMFTAHLFEIGPLLILGAFAPANWRARAWLILLAAGWFIAEFVAMAAPWKFFDHYFLLLLPPLCILSAAALARFMIDARAPWPRAVALVSACLVVEAWIKAGTARLAGQDITIFFVPGVILAGLTVNRLCAAIRRAAWWQSSAVARATLSVAVCLLAGALLWRPTWVRAAWPDLGRDIARVVQADQSAGATLWVVNSELITHILTGLPIMTRYVFPGHLAGSFASVTGIDTVAEVARILATRPTYIVLEMRRLTTEAPAEARIVHNALAQHYHLLADIRYPGGGAEVYRVTQ